MWKMIMGQAVYQLAVTFMLYFAGDKLLNAHLSTDVDIRAKELSTVVFNTFVWMQIFNEFNNRRLDNKFNIFEGMLRNYWFMGINAIMIGGQIMIIFVGGQAFSVTRISGILWAVCVICALGCLPWAILLRILPDRYFGIVFNGVVGAMAFILKPVARGFNVVGEAIQALFRPVSRFVRRKITPRARAAEEAPDEELSKIPMGDEEALASPPAIQIRQASPERPQTPKIAVPPITVTTSP